MCRHRATAVCRVERRNASASCAAIDGWTYRNDGASTRPGETEAYYDAHRQIIPRLIAGQRRDLMRGSSSRPGPRARRAWRPIWATRAGIVAPMFNRRDGACRPWPDENGSTGQLEDAGRQLLDNITSDQSPFQRAGPDPLSRAPAGCRTRTSSPAPTGTPLSTGTGYLPRRDDNAPRYVHGVSSETLRLFRSTTRRRCPRSSGGSAAARPPGQLGNHSISRTDPRARLALPAAR